MTSRSLLVRASPEVVAGLRFLAEVTRLARIHQLRPEVQEALKWIDAFGPTSAPSARLVPAGEERSIDSGGRSR